MKYLSAAIIMSGGFWAFTHSIDKGQALLALALLVLAAIIALVCVGSKN